MFSGKGVSKSLGQYIALYLLRTYLRHDVILRNQAQP
jgi:hypothetical protein